jgi:hypothetical protein
VEDAATHPDMDDLTRAEDAVPFAIKELPRELLLAIQLKVAEERFDGDGNSPVV